MLLFFRNYIIGCLKNVLMQERMDIRQSIWHSSGTLLNPKAMLPIIPCTAGVHPDVGNCCNAGVEVLSAASNVLANEEMFLEDSIITVSISSTDPRFLFLTISADGVCFLGVIVAAMVFSMLADVLPGKADDLVGVNDAEEHDATEFAAEDDSLSSLVHSEPASI